MTNTVRFLVALALGVCALLHTGMAAAQTYPNRPIRMLVGYAPGGGSDIIARLIATSLQARLGQPVLVENRPGAGGNVAIEQAAKARPDGYTLLVTQNTPTMAPALFANDVMKDFAATSGWR